MTGKAPELPPFIKDKGFALKEEVGDGGFSKVYRATWTKRPNEDVAAKIIKLADVNQEWVLKNLKNEMKIMRSLKHPNIIQVYDMMKTKTYAYIFMEFASNGSIFDVIRNTAKPMPEPKAKKYMTDVVSALAFCHGKGVAHRDIKPDNFLLDHNDRVKLTDFGFATINYNPETKLMKGTGCGTSEYMAIEVKVKKDGEVYDAMAADMYSLGISLYSMVYFDFPFDFSKPKECIPKQLKGEYKHKTRNNPTSDALQDLIDKLLDPNPKTRITSDGAKRHRWLSS